MTREMHLRLIYSLLKPAVRFAAQFEVPIRTVTELVRLAYGEVLVREELSPREIAQRLGQTERHVRSLRRKLAGDFFAAEKQVGLVREMEEWVALERPLGHEVRKRFESWPREEVDRAMSQLLDEGRIAQAHDGRLSIGGRFVVLSSEQFHHRIDALNHYLDGVFRAVLHRLVMDDRETSMIKTITFSALPDRVAAYLRRLEGDLRRDIAELEEDARFAGASDRRHVFTLAVAPEDSSGAAPVPPVD